MSGAQAVNPALAVMPKVELHCHLDGSVSPALYAQLYKEKHGAVPDGFAESLQAPLDCNTLTEYLAPFYAFLPLLQTGEAMELAAADVLRQSAADNVVYTEIRFAPMAHTAGGLSPDDVVRAALRGMEAAKAEASAANGGIEYGLLLCMMLGDSDEKNSEVLRLAQKFAGRGVVGIDIAGDENGYAVGQYAHLFEKATAMGLPFTIHAGENGPPENVAAAIALGAKRIGHGVAIRNTPALMQQCFEEDILLELCPTSNLQTKAVSGWQDFPFATFLTEGVPFVVNTDNRTVSGVTLNGEYAALAAHFYHARGEELRRMNREAMTHAFASDETKKAVLQRL